jgi:hypothetical protein
MTRSLLRPIRTRRIAHLSVPASNGTGTDDVDTLTPNTRKTLAAIGALWVSFATSVSASTPAPASAPASGRDLMAGRR